MKFPKIAILGGGQLGRMMIQEGMNYNLEFAVLDPDPQAPCSKIVDEFVVGSLKDFDTVYQFGKGREILTIEIEHINIEALEKLESEGVKIIPSPKILRTIQNKRWQKEFYQQHKIPTCPFVVCTNKADLTSKLDFLPAFQKLEKDGYDGKGVQFLKDENDLSLAFDAPSILEQSVEIEKEISIIIARNQQGEIAIYPSVEMEFDPMLNLVDTLVSPAAISPAIENECRALATRVAEAFQLEGILAVELFLTKKGEVLVNEVAPRAHNSGHHTIEACFTSQYEQQIKILTGLHLGDTSLIMPALMLNLIGEKGYEGEVIIQGLNEIDMRGVYIHMYGKKITKPGRKMGHITILGTSKIELLEKAKKIKEKVKIISKK